MPEACNFLVHDGIYTVGIEGQGTMKINWTAKKVNTNAPVDCSGDISPASYRLLLTSTSSLFLVESDGAPNCMNGAINYANCGALMAGTCTKQTGATFPKTVPVP